MPPNFSQGCTSIYELQSETSARNTSIWWLAADGVERVTGIPPQSIEAFVAARRDSYLG